MAVSIWIWASLVSLTYIVLVALVMGLFVGASKRRTQNQPKERDELAERRARRNYHR